MNDKVRIGFVGVGGMGQCAHLRNYAMLSDCEVVAIAEPRPELARRVAERYSVPKTYQTADAMLESEKLDAIVAIQRFEHHGSVVMPLYRYGLPILTEKPLASSVEVGEQMLEALKRGGSWHMVGYHKRSDPATVFAKKQIDEWKAGGIPLRYVRITMPEGDWLAGGMDDVISTGEAVPASPQDPAPPGMDEATFGRYVSFVNYYIHQVNLLRHLLGEPYRVTFADPSEVLVAFQSESGVPGILEMSPYKTSIGWQESALVSFERSYVKLNLPAPVALNRAGEVEVLSPGGETQNVQFPPVSAMKAQAMNFVAAVRGERPPPCEAAEALEDLRIAKDYLRC